MKEEQKGTPLSPSKVTSDGGGRPCNNERRYNNKDRTLFLYDYMQKSLIRAGIFDIWWTRSFLLTLAPQAVCKLLQEPRTVACPVGGYGGCTAANVLRAEID